ncbi:MAG: hypothetical protein LUQ07_06520 [Methanospirillum sp.]|nr:hypothetical protein [Methanospirillum sp.]
MVGLSSPNFTRREEEIADLFQDIGLKRNTARVLVLMISDADITSREIERVADLRQPEVSLALGDLMERKWVRTVRQISESKGRPVKIYHLSRRVDDILDDIKGSFVGECGKKIIDIERVRELVKENLST